ncbi:MAG TPA: alanine dehydrogenase [Anaerolineae bacterium]|nr:alanine dehydrogenase [Anaerolineae bacterium]HID85543.1 alanine dehydrogenase [Anaerolineales bacterium]HIQ09637.1 alanine dehydrogenase [Anaerolineaceae bacterium]
MYIGIPKERRPFEFRVGLSPAGVEALAQRGHTVIVEHNAGLGAGFRDEDYERAGARIVYSPQEVFTRADLLVKVARPLYEELTWMRPETILMGLLHLSSARQNKIDLLLEKGITAIAYEQIQRADGIRPVLKPMSQIGGSMAVQIATRLLQNNHGGKGILLGGLPGVPPAEVVIIGAGTVGRWAMRAFLGLGAHVTLLDISEAALEEAYCTFSGIVTMKATPHNIARAVSYADVVVGAVLVPGQRAPIVVTREMVRAMKPRSIIMDISIDEGGCVETSRPTTHDHPTFIEEGVIHYCVPNMPGVVARTATHALVNAALPYILRVVDEGTDAILEDPEIGRAVNTHRGRLHHLRRLTDPRRPDHAQ